MMQALVSLVYLLAPTASYFVVGSEDMPAITVKGKAVRVGEVINREVLPTGRDAQGFWRLRIDGREVVAKFTGGLDSQNWLRQTVEDDEVRRVRKQYQGRAVWVRGPYIGWYGSPFGFPEEVLTTDEKARVQRILKLHTPRVRLSFSGRDGDHMQADAPTDSMLIAVLDRLASGFSASIEGPADNLSGKDPIEAIDRSLRRTEAQHRGVPLALKFLDAEHLRMHLVTEDPRRTHRGWSKLTWRRIREADIHVGMSKEMVAWALGFPWERGTTASLMAKDVWSYPASAPFDSMVLFKNGRVKEYRPPRDLP